MELDPFQPTKQCAPRPGCSVRKQADECQGVARRAAPRIAGPDRGRRLAIVSSAKLINPEFLPPLSAVLSAWFSITLSGELPYHAAFSLLNLGVGLMFGAAAGVLVGLLMAWYPVVNATAGTIIQMTFPIPRSALIPVMILWFGLGTGSMIAAIFSGCLLPIVVSTYNGARGVEEALTWSALSLGATRRQVLWKSYSRRQFPTF